MAETKKSTSARKPARTIEQQIADLQAKAEAKQDRQRQIAWKKYEHAVESMKAVRISEAERAGSAPARPLSSPTAKKSAKSSKYLIFTLLLQ